MTSKKNNLHSVDWEDRADIVKEYPYIKIDNEIEELYVVIDGERKYLTLPYIPDPIDPHAIRILFKNKNKVTRFIEGKKEVVYELAYGLIDRDKEMYNLLVNKDIKRVTWTQNRQYRETDEKRHEIRALGKDKFINYLKDHWNKWSEAHNESNLPLHKFVEIRYVPKEMVEYSKLNKKGKNKVQIDHFSNDTRNNMYYNLRACFEGENWKPEIDKSEGLNNYVFFYDKDERGEIIERKFDSKSNVLNDNKKYCIISKCNDYELIDKMKTKNIIEIKENNKIKARAEIVMFLFDSYAELKDIIDKVTLSKEETKATMGDIKKTNKLKAKRNKGIAEALQELLTIENIEKKKVFAFAEDEKYALDNNKIGLVDVCRTDEKGQPLSVGIAKRRQFEEAKGVEVGDSIDEKNILSLFYYDIEKYIK